MTTLNLSTQPTPREVSERVNALLLGKINTTGTVTLSANVTTTTVTDINAHSNVVPILVPTTANAAAEDWRITSRATGSFVITHANAATTDRTFIYILMG